VTMAWPLAKSKPQASQNWPDLVVPHCGQGSAGADDAAGAEGADGAPAAAPADEAAGAGALSMRIPQLSQKSVLTLWWPAGQVGMAASLTSSS
jgi:hypothetical protein